MKGLEDLPDFLGIIIIFILIGLVSIVLISQSVFKSTSNIGCVAKQNEAINPIITSALNPNSYKTLIFTLPDCVENFKAGQSVTSPDCPGCNPLYTYCFKEYGSGYRCVDTNATGSKIFFQVNELSKIGNSAESKFCFAVSGEGRYNPQTGTVEEEPRVIHVIDSVCQTPSLIT